MDFSLTNYLPVSEGTAIKCLFQFIKKFDERYSKEELSSLFSSLKIVGFSDLQDFFCKSEPVQTDIQKLAIGFKNTLSDKDAWIFLNWYLSCMGNVVAMTQFLSSLRNYIAKYELSENEGEDFLIKAQLILSAWEEFPKIALKREVITSDKSVNDFWESGLDGSYKDNGKIVLSEIGDVDSREGQDLKRRYKSILNVKLNPQISDINIKNLYYDLKSKFPWALEVVDIVCGQLALHEMNSTSSKLPPLLLVGPPGCGKTHLLSDIAKFINARFALVPCAGTADHGGLNAVARGWSSCRPCAPVIYMEQFRVPDPIIIIDELDKSSGAENKNSNGSVTGALLTMMSGGERYFDQCLLSEVDLSHVNFMATANKLDSIPEPLRDRFTIIHMKGPKSEHFDVLFNNIIKDLNFENLPDLENWELDMLKEILDDPNASIRKIIHQYKYMIGAKALKNILPNSNDMDKSLIGNILNNIKFY